ncbi:four-carbon acid sugar kinase family protein [Paenibacillus sp. FSL R10-2734]|uniref:four-carbon acid sugar kinase family protein n=1 Tax=Paenibacillus sp. FSL R10-2734 TaxID=2954691 RepID=UPI0030D86025
MEKLKLVDVLHQYKQMADPYVSSQLKRLIQENRSKIIVLDDDPTGVQTVHGVTVITDWSQASIRQGFLTEQKTFFILTNSRSFTAEETRAAHREIAKNIITVSRELNCPYLLVSRGDSTLRGHYPLETDVLRETIEHETKMSFDGEIICPFFKEGGRYTLYDVHYVERQGLLTPCSETEFAQDKTFGYQSSDLREWVDEKTSGQFPKQQVLTISLEELRSKDVDAITAKLFFVSQFNKVIVNALDYQDLEVFCLALYEVMGAGKQFLFRTAASFVRVFGGIHEQPLLTSQQLFQQQDDTSSITSERGGLIVAGSHTHLTTAQLNRLGESSCIVQVELNQHLAVEAEEIWLNEMLRISCEVKELLQLGQTVVLCTRRERFDVNNGSKEDELRVAVRISGALTEIVAQLSVRPRYIVAKGGITSSDIGTKALQVKQAVVAGQIKPGIPVWICGAESKFPNLPYIIFPGNVGKESTLLEIVEELKL